MFVPGRDSKNDDKIRGVEPLYGDPEPSRVPACGRHGMGWREPTIHSLAFNGHGSVRLLALSESLLPGLRINLQLGIGCISCPAVAARDVRQQKCFENRRPEAREESTESECRV